MRGSAGQGHELHDNALPVWLSTAIGSVPQSNTSPVPIYASRSGSETLALQPPPVILHCTPPQLRSEAYMPAAEWAPLTAHVHARMAASNARCRVLYCIPKPCSQAPAATAFLPLTRAPQRHCIRRQPGTRYLHDSWRARREEVVQQDTHGGRGVLSQSTGHRSTFTTRPGSVSALPPCAAASAC